MYKIGIIGFGKMGSAIINGLIDSKSVSVNEILIYDIVDIISNRSYVLAKSELEVYTNCETLILATKPQQFESLFKLLKSSSKKPSLVISIAAGKTLNYLNTNLGVNNYVRVLPDLNAMNKMSTTTLAYENIDQVYVNKALMIFESIGSVYVVKEEEINKYMPIQGSFPAYIWSFIENFITSAVQTGVTYEDAYKVISSTLYACATTMKNEVIDLPVMINNVCSKNGTTIEGIEVFNNENLKDMIFNAYNACYNRALEIEKE